MDAPRRPAASRRPPAWPTRGKTAPNRLRKTDAYLALAYPVLVRTMRGWYIDLGFGASPVTTVETLRRLRHLNPRLRVLGVDIDPERVRAARPLAEPGLDSRVGGFELPLQPGERACVARAFNVLRQYDEGAVEPALTALSGALAPGGILLEGTSDSFGRLLAFQILERRPGRLERVAFVLAPRLHRHFSPRRLRAVLPKAFIHHAAPGGAVDRFFLVWHAAWQAARRHLAEPRAVFVAAARTLADRHGYRVDPRQALLRRGFLTLGPEWPEATHRPA